GSWRAAARTTTQAGPGGRTVTWRWPVAEGLVTASACPRADLGTMSGTGVDPAITGEPPEERHRSFRPVLGAGLRRSVEPDGAGPSQPQDEWSHRPSHGRAGQARWYRGSPSGGSSSSRKPQRTPHPEGPRWPRAATRATATPAPPPRRRTRAAAPRRACPSSRTDRKSTRLNSSHVKISYAVFCLKKK